MVEKRVNGRMQVKIRARDVVLAVVVIILLAQITAMAYVAVDQQAKAQEQQRSKSL